MTAAARLVLQDAKHAISEHADDLGGESFRISWFAITGLLRAVGHVLSKVDSTSSPEMASAIEAKWRELQRLKPEPEIFWGFIESERNRFLKSYDHSVNRSFDVKMHNEDGSVAAVVTSIIVSRSHGIDTRSSKYALRSVLDQGPFKGQSERQVAGLAVDWWEAYLDSVDEFAMKCGHDF